MHRHDRADRPPHLRNATLLWREPEIGDTGTPNFGVDEVIYARYILLKTWLKLRGMSALRTPDDIDELMDYVYSDDCAHDEIGAELQAAHDDMDLGNENSAFRGGMAVIGAPGDERLIGRRSQGLPDDEERHAATRDIRPGVDIICIVDSALQPISERVPGQDDLRALLDYKVTIRNAKVKQALESLPEHDKWAKQPQLRFARPLLFEGDCYNLQDSPFSLRLTQEYGLEIISEEEE